MPNVGDEEIEAALRPIESLISKSEKAKAKLAPGTWQHVMLGDHIEALHVARTHLGGGSARAPRLTRAQVAKVLDTLGSMIEKSERVKVKFAEGTSQRTLQENRIQALRLAAAAIEAAFGRKR